MDSSGGAAGKRAKPSSDSAAAAREDLISALPDDILSQILAHLRTPDAVRTSLVSRRWRRVWALLPDLRVRFLPEPNGFRAALAAHQVDLRSLQICDHACGPRAGPEALAIWLPAAAARVSGRFVLFIGPPLGRSAREEEGEGVVELPCFEDAASIWMSLQYLSLAVPPAGVFARLTNLTLEHVRFHGPSELGDALSTLRCPCLLQLKVGQTHGLEKLTIRSETLVKMVLRKLRGLRELTIEAPVLEVLSVARCFSMTPDRPVATISAPQLEYLELMDPAGQECAQLSQMPHLRSLGIGLFFVYGSDDFGLTNHACIKLVQHFQVIETLSLILSYLPVIDDSHYMMEDMKVLPNLTVLHLILSSNGHAFGASSFHVLRMCTGIRKLVLELYTSANSEEQTGCPSGCICDQQPADWHTEELLLVQLEEIQILELRGSDHEVSFLKRLFDWAIALVKVEVTFDASVTETKAKELRQMFQSLSKSGVCMTSGTGVY